MSTKPSPLPRWLLRAGAGIVILATIGWAWPPPTARNTFYAWLMPTELARADVGRTPFFGGS